MASNQFSRKIAWRYLWSKRREAFISIISVFAVIGVCLGVAVLDITMSIMTGFEHVLQSKIVGDSHIFVHRYPREIDQPKKVISIVNSVPGVTEVSSFSGHQALISYKGASRGIYLKGVKADSPIARQLGKYILGDKSLEQLFQDQKLEQESEASEQSKVSTLPTLVLGKELVDQLGIYPQVPVSILIPKVSSTPFGMVPRFKRFLVSGIYKSGLVGYEEGLVYTQLANSQKYFKMGDAVSGLEIKIADVAKSPELAKKIRTALWDQLDTGYSVKDWTESNKELWEALKLEKQVYFIVLLLLVVLASFSIISTLIMIVMEKRRDIAVLMALGASPRKIANIFRWQGVVIGLVGTLSGTLMGYLGCLLLRAYGFPLPEKIFPTDTVPVHMEPYNFIVVAVAAFFISSLSTWYPARRASSVDPTELLRYE